MVSITDSSGDEANFLTETKADILTLSLPLDQNSKHF
jgi:hypothetical protein